MKDKSYLLDEILRSVKERGEAARARRQHFFGALLRLLEVLYPQGVPELYEEMVKRTHDVESGIRSLGELSRVPPIFDARSPSLLKRVYKRILGVFLRPIIRSQHTINCHLAESVRLASQTMAQQQDLFFRLLGLMVDEIARGTVLAIEETLERLRSSEEEQQQLQTARTHTEKWMDELRQELNRLRWNFEDRLAALKGESSEHSSPPGGYSRPSLGFDMSDFEFCMRSREQVIENFRFYLPYFKGCSQVLDAGCGGGEFLELLRESGGDGYGIDSDRAMVEICREKGLNVLQSDVVSHLREIAPGSIDGFFAAQLIEHLHFNDLLELIRLLDEKLKAGSAVVLETVNSLCLTIFVGSFYADPTHIRPVHPETLAYVLRKLGFRQLELRLRNPFPEKERLQEVAALLAEDGNEELQQLGQVLDENFQKLNRLLFSYADYALICRKA